MMDGTFGLYYCAGQHTSMYFTEECGLERVFYVKYVREPQNLKSEAEITSFS